MEGRLVSWAAIAGLLIAAACGVLGGLVLAERASTPATQTLALPDPRDAEDTREPFRSSGGFTGFEGLALAGPVERSGEIASVEGGSFEVVSGEAVLAVEITSPDRLYRIQTATRPLSVGDVVVIRLDDAEAPQAVLRVPGDLRED